MPMPNKWILDERGTPVPCEDLMTWADWMEKHHPVVIAQDKVGKVEVSTVFLGVAAPRLEDSEWCFFESMVFGGTHDRLQRRYRNRDEALEGHRKLVEALTCGDMRGIRPQDKGILGLFAHMIDEANRAQPPEEDASLQREAIRKQPPEEDAPIRRKINEDEPR